MTGRDNKRRGADGTLNEEVVRNVETLRRYIVVERARYTACQSAAQTGGNLAAEGKRWEEGGGRRGERATLKDARVNHGATANPSDAARSVQQILS